MSNKNLYVLASASPRRKEILEKNGYNIIVIDSFGEKNIVGEKFSKQLVEECAYSKAKFSYEKYKEDNNFDNIILISSDTVVVNNGIIYGKPKNKNEAIEMLKSLSGKVHTVVSAISIIVCNNGKEKYYNDSEETKVYFRKFSDKEIEQYLERSKPYDKAGSYGIQDKGFDFVEKIDGNIDNVIGFPIETFKKLIKKSQTEHNKFYKLIQLFLIIVALGFVYIGIRRGDLQEVYKKASKICFECIGIG